MNHLLYIRKEMNFTSRIQELLNLASAWKRESGGKLFVVLFGKDSDWEEKLQEWPIEKIFVVPQKEEQSLEESISVFQRLIQEEKIQTIFTGNSLEEREVAAYAAASFDWEFVPNAESFSWEADNIVWERFLYGTRAIEKSKTRKERLVVSFSANIYKRDERVYGEKDRIESKEISPRISSLLPYLLRAREEKTVQKHPLETAKIVIGVGKGIKGKENFPMVEELADLLGATIGVTRSVVDNGWRPEYEKIGQTGKIIKPELYLGFGISGAMQHMAGVQQARHIVMVNSNPNAESFRASDFGIIADLFEVIPDLIAFLKKEK